MTVIINGSNTPTAGAVAVGDGTTLNFTAAGTAGQVLTSNGTSVPTWTDNGAGTVTSVGGTGTVNGITLTGTVTSTGNLTLGGTLSGVSLATQVSGTLPVGNGGTGATSLTANNVILGNGTSAVQVVAPSTSGNVLTSNGTTWQSSALPAGVSLSADNTWTGKQTFNGTTSKLATKLFNASEAIYIIASAAGGSTTFRVTDYGSILYFTNNSTSNYQVSIIGNDSNSLNSIMSVGESLTLAYLAPNGGTAYYLTQIQVDGTTSGVTTKWQGGTAPTSGNASSIDVYTFTVIKTASATFTVLASQTKFA